VLVLGALGLATAVQRWWATDLKPWLAADSAHGWLVGTGVLCILAVMALYGVEKEADALRLNGVKIEEHYVYQARWWENDNRLTVDVRFGFFNNSALQTSARVHQVQLQRKRYQLWMSPPYDFYKGY